MINVQYPDSLADLLKLNSTDFAMEIKTSSMIKLYEIGKISSSIAAGILGISRQSFLDLLSRYKVSIFDLDKDDLKHDFENA